MSQVKRELELLAPARDLQTAFQAILHGADAVYIGAPSHGARAKASNSIDDIRRLVEFAAPFGVKVYVTVNTIVYDDEIDQVASMIRSLYQIGVDALIVQDLGILEMDIPPIALHASTQCDTRTPERAKFLADAGFSQIVVARELNPEELAKICSSVDVPVEAFVHGALCVCYSGDCQASYVNNGRSANRGDCAQMCRLPYDLVDGNGKVLGVQRHYLSLRDMNRIDKIASLAEAGVRSFKIEGRLKDGAYVKNVTAAYRQAIDKFIASNSDRFCRSSRGESVVSFAPSLSKSFNRGFTDYFFSGNGTPKMATFDSPKSLGRLIGRVRGRKGRVIEAELKVPVANGDGLSYITPKRATGGFRVNRAEGSRLHLLEEVDVPVGSELYMSFDRQWEAEMQKPTADRKIPVEMTLREINGDRIDLSGRIDGVGETVVTAECALSKADNPVGDYRIRTLSKTGNTIFSVKNVADEVGDRFIPASALSDLRRRLCEAMMQTLIATRKLDYRRKRSGDLVLAEKIVTRHENVSNRLARKFYADLGAERIEDAVELQRVDPNDEIKVMTTRYCLRREIGACLREGGAEKVAGPLYLRGAGFTYRLDFDCRNCQMNVFRTFCPKV